MLRELMRDITSEEQARRVAQEPDTDTLLDELVELYRDELSQEDVDGTVRSLSEQLLRCCDYHPI